MKSLGDQRLALSITVSVMLFAVCLPVSAQQPEKIPRIGFLCGPSYAAQLPRTEAFRKGLQELGYLERKNIQIEWRYADGKLDRLPALATELVRDKVALIVTAGGSSTRAAKEASSTIPIVMTNDPDPVSAGFIRSLARPSGNITGVSNLAPEISGKRLELLKEMLPKLSHVAVVGASTNPGNDPLLREAEVAAGALGMKVHYFHVTGPKDIDTAFQAAIDRGAEAILILQTGVLNSQRAKILERALKSRLPAMHYSPEWVEEGGLMAYSPNSPDLSRRAATYVVKILKGARPADLPVEQPRKFDLWINLKTAKQIGLTIPPNVLARADRVIR